MHYRRSDAGGVARIWLALASLLICLLFAACKTKDHAPLVNGGDGPDDFGPGLGQACKDEGRIVDCGHVERIDGNYVTCSLGHAQCSNGFWGACAGDHLVTKSLPDRQLTMGGYRLTATNQACTNPCNPDCSALESDPKEVDASGIVPAGDGGVTLEKNDAGATPTKGMCKGLQCNLVTCGKTGTTTITGQVFDPAGQNPLFNAYVYVPLNPDAELPPFSSGANCDTCNGSGTFDALRATQTDADGNFVLSDVPAGKNIPIVVQMGKWRREIVLSNVTACGDSVVKSNCTTADPDDCMFRLPRSRSDGWDPVKKSYSKADLPQIAIVTGSADPFDCLLLKAGIDPSEFGDYTSDRRVHYYQADTKPGNSLDAAYGQSIKGSTLWNSLSSGTPNMMTYDVILFPCEGGAVDKQSTGFTPYQNIIDYANSGGRAFMTHFSYSWLQYPAGKKYVAAPDNWSQVANWAPTGTGMTSSVNTQDPLTGTVNTSFPKGANYSTWLNAVGATATPSRLTIHEGRQDLTTIGASVQPWMTAKDINYAKFPNYTNLFTFNTPYGADAAKQCGRVVFSDFHVSANALVGTSKCLTDADCGFTSTCIGSKPGAIGQCSEPCNRVSDCPRSSFICQGAVQGKCQQDTCTKSSDCGTGRWCRGGTCTCASDDDCEGACTNRTCSTISCTSSATCGVGGTCAGGTCNSVACHKNADCGLGTCGGVGRYGKCPGAVACHKDSECGPTGTCGVGTSSTAGSCSTGAQACHVNSECDSNSCGAGTGATAGTCAWKGATACRKNTDCDSNSCGAGTGATAGACAYGATTVCHKNTDCDSNSCGTGTGATLGTCAWGATTVCHKNTDCDSNSCGTGTGAVLGACAWGASTVCHKHTDCDSNSCGTGTGSTAGSCSTTSASCHKNADCDSNSCGAGTSAVAGTCGTTTTTACHKAADCDSGTCGSGASGSLKGVCTAGTCTTNAQCGTGGTCVLNKCVTGACSIDTNCGTAGGICTGATCLNKTCKLDTDCGTSKVCNGATCGKLACAIDTDCGVSSLCNSAKCSTGPTCAGDAACPNSGLCNNAKCSTPATCAGDAGCPNSKLCNNSKCSTPAACAGDVGCPASATCNGAKCSNSNTCAGDAGCPNSKLCNGAKCATQSCAGDPACSVSKLCNGAKCSTSICSADAECPGGALNSCSGAKCAPPATCGNNTDCGTGGKCTGATCSQNPCTTDAECGVGSTCGGSCEPRICLTGNDCGSGFCSAGTCSCATGEDCGGSQTCTGASQGSCFKACVTNADCSPDLCVNGQCGGCTSSADCHDNAFPASCGGIPAANYGTCSPYAAGKFPEACKSGTLSPQEKALEFMFFDLTACVSPDNLPPPPPVTAPAYAAAKFTEDFTAVCPAGKYVKWREFDWQAQIPDTASIQISAQSGADSSSLLPATPLLFAKATKSTDTGPSQQNFDFGLLDTGANGSGAFNTAVPAVASRALLRITILLNPTNDHLAAPTLRQWKVQYDCPDSE